MAKTSASLAESLARRVKAVDGTRRSVEATVLAGSVSVRSAEQLYEGLFLAVFTSFETFLEDLFVGLLVQGSGLVSSRSDVVPRMAIRSHQIARDVVIGPGSRRYAAWMPFEATERRAKMLFRGGRPFALLEIADRHALNQAYVIRNAIAHKSRESLRQFNAKVIGSLPLPAREQTPGGFLRSTFRAAPVQRRYEVVVAGLVGAARKLSK